MKGLKIGAVIFGALIITALGIDAADTLSGKGGTMLGQLIETENGVCPRGMVEVPNALSFTCIDKYEASVGEKCPVIRPSSETESQDNINEFACTSESKADSEPWSFITRDQAQAVCARAGKRLPTSEEWYQAALGSVDTGNNCNVNTNSVEPTGSRFECLSAAGSFDMIGNVWEWTGDDIIDGQYNGRSLPGEGYVDQVDAAGVATLTNSSPNLLYNDDYFWTNESGAYGVLRGGFYGSDSDAGVYAFHAKTPTRSAGIAIGFRCVK